MPSSRKKKTHVDHCLSVCLLCFSKIPCGKTALPIREREKTLIERFVVSGLNPADSRLPSVLCKSCNLILNLYDKGNFERKIRLFDHSQIQGSSMLTREHTCTVCEIGSALFGNKNFPRSGKGRPTLASDKETPTPIKICSFCFSQSSPGRTHICTNATREKNLFAAVLKNEKTGEKIASSVLKQKFENKKAKNLKLIQKSGRHMKVTITGKKDKENKETCLTNNDMLRIKSSIGLSGRETIELAKNLRSAAKNRKFVQPGLKNKLHSNIHKLDDVFHVQKLENSTIPLVYCTNIEECLQIIEHMPRVGNDK